MNNPTQKIKDQEAEIQDLKKKNLRLRNHLSILVMTPESRMAERIRFTHGKVFHDSIINLN